MGKRTIVVNPGDEITIICPGTDELEEQTPAKESFAQVQKWWNEECVKVEPRLPTLGDKRTTKTRADFLKKYNARLKECPTFQVDVLEMFKKGITDFALDASWLNLAWLIQSDNNLGKFLEGNYVDHERTKTVEKSYGSPSGMPTTSGW